MMIVRLERDVRLERVVRLERWEGLFVAERARPPPPPFDPLLPLVPLDLLRRANLRYLTFAVVSTPCEGFGTNL